MMFLKVLFIPEYFHFYMSLQPPHPIQEETGLGASAARSPGAFFEDGKAVQGGRWEALE